MHQPRLFLLGGLLAALAGCAKPPAPITCPEGTVAVPQGPFLQGSSPRQLERAKALDPTGYSTEHGWIDRDLDQREAHLDRYCLMTTPVTQQAYAQAVAADAVPVPHIGPKDYERQGYKVHPYDEVRPFLWRDGGPPPDKANHPVVLVNHRQAKDYCVWWGTRHGVACDLPTEAQWEKGARGTDGRLFPWGDAWDPAKLNSAKAGPYTTTPVDSHPEGASPYGALDMAGNVFEWTLTPWDVNEDKLVVKGGSWDDTNPMCRSAARHGRAPDARHILIGFRCVCQ